MEAKIIEEEDVEGIIGLLESSDPENKFIGWTVLESCDMARSLPWLLVIFRLIKDTTRVEMMKGENSKQLWEYLSSVLKIDGPPMYFTSQDCYDNLQKCANNEAAIAYIERDYAKKLKVQMIAWGYNFLEKYDLTLTKNDGN